MRDELRQQFTKEMTRKQFLQVLAGLTLSVFGFHNLLTLLGVTGHHSLMDAGSTDKKDRHGFGSSRFGI